MYLAIMMLYYCFVTYLANSPLIVIYYYHYWQDVKVVNDEREMEDRTNIGSFISM